MEEVMLNIKALAAMRNQSVEKLAEDCGIPFAHLRNIMYGRAVMSADDLTRLSNVTGVPTKNIIIKY